MYVGVTDHNALLADWLQTHSPKLWWLAAKDLLAQLQSTGAIGWTPACDALLEAILAGLSAVPPQTYAADAVSTAGYFFALCVR
jgi:hypothetical protein